MRDITRCLSFLAHTDLPDAELRRLLRLLLQPDPEALVHHVEWRPAEEEVWRAEGGQAHPGELGVPRAERRKLLLVLGRRRVGREALV